MKIFVTAFKNTISHMKSNLTPFSFYLICILTVLSFFLPLDMSGSDREKLSSLIVTSVLVLAALYFLTEYLFALEVSMQITRFGNYSLLSLFVKRTPSNYHIYANLSTIVIVSAILFIAISFMIHFALPIAIALGFMTMFTMLPIP